MPEWAATPVNEITAGDVRRVVSNIQWTSAKTRNNSIIPLRGVMALCVDDDLITSNPVDRIKNLKHQKPEVDPFTIDEADKIVSWMRENYTGKEAIIPVYFELAFWTGMRTSELLALRWSDIDFNAGFIRVSKAQSQGRLNPTTKTKRIRDVLLNDRSRAALLRAKPLTYMKGGLVIISAATGRGWISDKAPRVIFTRVLRKLGIRHRPTYNTRHTYASICLMAGMNPAFVSNQLGNSVQVLMSTYAKWIHGEASRAELDKLNKPELRKVE
jgi:integrase